MQINVQNHDKISHEILNICCFMYANNTKMQNAIRSKKYLWLYALIILCLFIKIEAGESTHLQGQTYFKVLITAVNVALKKVFSPITGFFSQKPSVKIEEHHRNIGFFTLLGMTSRTGSLNRLLTSMYKLPTMGISTPQVPINNPVEQQDIQIMSTINFKAIMAVTLRALKKISLPNTPINLQKAWSLIQAHPKKSSFSIFAAGVAGIFFYGGYNKQIFMQVHGTEALQHIRQVLQEKRLQIHQAQQEIATIAAKETSKQAECLTLRQEITLLQQLYEETRRANLTSDMLERSMQLLEKERDRYRTESLKFVEQKKEWSEEKTRIEEFYAHLTAQLEKLGSLYIKQMDAAGQLEAKKWYYEAQLRMHQQRLLPRGPLAKTDPASAAAAIQPIRISSPYPSPTGTRLHASSDIKPDSQKTPVIKRDRSYDQSLKQADAQQETITIFEELKRQLKEFSTK